MLLEFFDALSSMLSSSPGIAVAGSFLWGVAGILLSPCHLAGIPLIVGYIDSQGEMKTSRAALIATLFSSGILITIAVIGVITGLAGRMMGDIGQYGNIIVALLMIVIGLYLLGVLYLSLFLTTVSVSQVLRRRGSLQHFFWDFFSGLRWGHVLLLIWLRCLVSHLLSLHQIFYMQWRLWELMLWVTVL